MFLANSSVEAPSAGARRGAPALQYAIAAIACAVTTLVATPLRHYFDLANIVMLFLLVVVLIARRLGRGPAVMSAFLSVALFDFFFVPPRLSFAVSDVQYLLTFAVMLTVALIIAHLTAGLRQQAQAALIDERRTHALYETAREVAGSLSPEQVSCALQRFVSEAVRSTACLLLPDPDGRLVPIDRDGHEPAWVEMPVARVALAQGAIPPSAAHPVGYFAVSAGGRTRGVIAVAAPGADSSALREHHDVLQTLASLAAVALERLHYVEVANAAQLRIMSERLRSSILSALSHDLRTPLTALIGLADSLALAKPPLPAQQRETAEAVRDQALRLHGLVVNLLDMARLNAGEVKLRKEWQPIEEVVGSSLKLLERSLADHEISTNLPQDLPLVEFDAVLIERVLCNLLENAARYAPPRSTIAISARVLDAYVEIAVHDRGPGIHETHDVFEMFVRGAKESNKPGVGLGLAICRAIVEAHGGSIGVKNDKDGAEFAFTLPLGVAPTVEDDELAPSALS